MEKKEIELPEATIVPSLESWKPRTQLGMDVFGGKITDIHEILEKGLKIKEPQIVDKLVPSIKNELVLIGGRPGKGGGIQRTPLRVSAKMHKSGRRYKYTAFVVVGDGNGLIGCAKGGGKEGRRAVEKATEQAKLNLIQIPRGCGSWECGCGEPHSIPFQTTGKSSSVRVILLPAPKGVGLAANDETKKLLKLAGIRDVWMKTIGNTSTRFNLIKATVYALKSLHTYRRSD